VAVNITEGPAAPSLGQNLVPSYQTTWYHKWQETQRFRDRVLSHLQMKSLHTWRQSIELVALSGDRDQLYQLGLYAGSQYCLLEDAISVCIWRTGKPWEISEFIILNRNTCIASWLIIFLSTYKLIIFIQAVHNQGSALYVAALSGVIMHLYFVCLILFFK
jgi:hypothetical protein